MAERFIELSVIMYYRPLTTVELKEFFESYQWLIQRQWKLAFLKNLSLMASMTGDMGWQHEICAMIEKLEGM